ncbi:MAG: eukaryotic-like serine/threonine-protein kinase [Frankiaceae bacterium]|nr:eukaryotic-like serine/threonine-protein kinase [Frankiaceae bacterium]
MLRVPGYIVGEALGRAEPPRAFAATAEVDGRPIVLRRSAASGIVARDALRTAVARVAGVRSADLVVPSTVVTTPEGLVIVYDAAVATVWDGVADFAEPAAAVLAVVRAVAALHEAGLAHGALVPESVWLDADGTVRLACLPGPEEADMSADRKNLQRFTARIAAGDPALEDALEDAIAMSGDPTPRDLLSRLAPFAAPVVPVVPMAPADPVHAPVAPSEAAPREAAPREAVPQATVVQTRPLAVPGAGAPDHDVLRAPRPNRPITTPAATAAKRRLRPVTVAVVGIAVLLGAAGIGVAAAQITRDEPAPLAALASTRTTSATATSVPPFATPPGSSTTQSAPARGATPPPPVGDAPWVSVMTTLDGIRDTAFVAADPTQLASVYVDGSSAAIADHAAMSELRDTGVHADGLRLTVHEVRLIEKSAGHVTLRVVDELPSYRLVDARGGTVRTEAARGATTWRIALQQASAGWRIATIERLAP